MNISIHNKGKNTEINVSLYVPRYGHCTFTLTRTDEHPIWAAFISDAMEDQFASQIEEIRKNAYNKGWADKRSRKKKQKYFDSCVNTTSCD